MFQYISNGSWFLGKKRKWKFNRLINHKPMTWWHFCYRESSHNLIFVIVWFWSLVQKVFLMLTYSWLQSNFHKSDYIDLYFSKRSSWKSLINWRNLHKNIFKLSLTQFFSLRSRIMCKCFRSISVWKHKSIGNQASDCLT